MSNGIKRKRKREKERERERERELDAIIEQQVLKNLKITRSGHV